MSTHQIDIIILASLTALTCALPGTFLVLRRVSLMSDAISHAILLGIVLVFFLTKSLTSPFLIVGAALMGLVTVALTEVIINTRKLKKDAAIGLVFPFLFSIGVILLNKFAHDVHLDANCILFGELAFTPFERLIIGGHDWGPQSTWVILGALVLNVVFIVLFYKELKIATFDPGLAAALGFFPVAINYALMSVVSITAVASFESVGSILVVALMITPPAAAYLLTNRVSMMITLSGIIGVLSALSGYAMAYVLDANIAGSMATMSGVLFFMVLIFAPERGLIARGIVRKWTKWDFAADTLAVHLLQAEMTHAEETEHVVEHMNEHMLWKDQYTSEVIVQGLQEGLIERKGNKLMLTPYGREKAKRTMSKE